jgi:hypothetical protein
MAMQDSSATGRSPQQCGATGGTPLRHGKARKTKRAAMSEVPEHRHEQEGGPPPGGHSFSQDFRHAPISARIPERVRSGVFCTATMILQTADEFVIDFLSTMVQPQQLVARVIMTGSTFGRLTAALQANIAGYEQQFGPLRPRPISPPAAALAPAVPGAPAAPGAQAAPGAPAAGLSAPAAGASPPPPETVPQAASEAASHQPPPASAQPSVADLYDQLKLPDELLAGVFANVVMIRHTPEEFCFDFIANFYPRPVVTARTFVSAGRIPAVLDAMSNALQKYQQARKGGSQPAPDKDNPPAE